MFGSIIDSFMDSVFFKTLVIISTFIAVWPLFAKLFGLSRTRGESIYALGSFVKRILFGAILGAICLAYIFLAFDRTNAPIREISAMIFGPYHSDLVFALGLGSIIGALLFGYLLNWAFGLLMGVFGGMLMGIFCVVIFGFWIALAIHWGNWQQVMQSLINWSRYGAIVGALFGIIPGLMMAKDSDQF